MKRPILKLSGIVLLLLGLAAVAAAIRFFMLVSSDQDAAAQHERASSQAIAKAASARDDIKNKDAAEQLFDEADREAALAKKYQRAADNDVLLGQALGGGALICLVAGPTMLWAARRPHDEVDEPQRISDDPYEALHEFGFPGDSFER